MMDYKKEWIKKNSRRKILLIVFSLLAVSLGVMAVNVYLEILQYDEIGNFSSAYIKNLLYQLVFSLAAGGIAFFVFALSGFFVRKNCTDYFKKTGMNAGKMYIFIPAVVAGLITAVWVKDKFYREALLFFNKVSFSVKDPVFGKDIGYYIFQRPFLMTLLDFLTNLWIAAVLFTILYYLVSFSTVFSRFSFRYLKIDTVLTHNLINVGIFFMMLACSFPLTKQGFLFDTVNEYVGASFVQVKVWIPYYTIMTFVLPIVTVLAYYLFKKSRYKKALIAIGVIPFLWAAAMVASFVVKETMVKPNELYMESSYLKNNILMTRQAYGIDRITTVESPEPIPPSRELIQKNKGFTENIPVTDEGAALSSFNRYQKGPLFYTFGDADILDYTVNGKKTKVIISAREINRALLSDKSYINLKYRYTHGYGLVMSYAGEVNTEGEPEYVIKELTHESSDSSLKVLRPEIYYGEMTYDYAIVNASGIREIDFDGSTESRYEGSGGIPLTFWNRLFFALEYRDINLISSEYAKNATLLTNRQILNRAQMAAPFLELDKDPYLILNKEGRLKWVINAYTYSDRYPCSRYTNGINYIRHSVKIVIDAYDGKTELYVIDPSDPLIQAYMKMYPGIFRTDPLPEDIKSYGKYPKYLFEIQSDLLRKYHLEPEQTDAFYTQNRLWAIAKAFNETASASLKDHDPYYVYTLLPGQEKPGSYWIRAFTPAGDNRHDLTSYLAVGCGPMNYGELILVTFPNDVFVWGPYRWEEKIGEIEPLAEQIRTLRQNGFNVAQGKTTFLPVENSLLYVAPIYLRPSGYGGAPRVLEIVAGYSYGNEFTYGRGKTLSDALTDLFEKDEDREEEREVEKLEELMEKLSDLKKQLEDLQEQIENLYNESKGN
jgi:uncharacterized membrane protein (UPF0182 family)